MNQSESKKLKAIIVDDEELARQGLSMRIEQYEDLEIVAECRNGKEAIAAIIEHEPDVVFLDIQMPGMTGFEVINEVQGDVMPMIIFVTAYDAFAVAAFKVHAIDYLLKPVEVEGLARAIDRAKQQKEQKVAIPEKQKLLELAVSLTGKSASAIGELIYSEEDIVERADRLAI